MKDFLDERRLITTRLRVAKPRSVEVSLKVAVVLKPQGAAVDRLKRALEESLRRSLHPTLGGPEGQGWPFGRAVFKSDLYRVVESVEGVDHVEDLEIMTSTASARRCRSTSATTSSPTSWTLRSARSPRSASHERGGPAPAEETGDGLAVVSARRESALERLKKKLADREVPVPQLEGYPLAKARKILRLVGIEAERLKVKYAESEVERGTVIAQRPRPGEKIDLDDEDDTIELRVADSSMVRYLPNLYNRSDLTGRNFVRDLLWVFQHEFNATDEKLEGLERFFDPLECPREFLDYIASWVALTLEDEWPEHKKRNLIKKAVELYHLRGTPRGLRIFLRIFTGVDPKIHENVWPFDGITVGIERRGH